MSDHNMQDPPVDNPKQKGARVTYEMMEAVWWPPARTGAWPDWMEPSRSPTAVLLLWPMKRTVAEASAVFWLAGLGASCGGQGLGSVGAPLDLSTCQDNWRVLLQDSGSDWTITTDLNGSGLSWSDGQLYFEHRDSAWNNPGTLASIYASTPVGSYTDLVPVDSPSWWIEDQQLIYVSGAYLLYTVPLAGGTQPTLLVDLAQDTPNPFFINFVLDAEAIYWVSLQQVPTDVSGWYTTTGWSVWRALRATGERQQLAIMPVLSAQSGLGASLVLTRDAVVVYDGIQGLTGTLFVVPKAGGGPVALPSPSSASYLMLGTSFEGVALWRTSASGGGGYLMWRSTSDGAAPLPFSTDMPPTLSVTNAWSDGNGGWYMAAWESTDATMNFASQHATLWTLDKSGHGARLACNPLGDMTREYATALSPTAVFLLDSDDSRQVRSIVSIARSRL